MSALTDALGQVVAAAVKEGGLKAVALAEATVRDAVALGGEAGARAAEAATVLTETLADVAAGRLTPEAGRVIADRALEALDEVKRGAKEAAQRVAAQRARDGLALAKDVGLAALRVALVAGAAAL